METTNKVYSVIVTYNAAHWLQKCFSTVRESSVHLNTIVIDNGSTDNTVAILRNEFPETDIIVAEKNLGFGRANNIGIKKAYDEGADFIFLMNQDVYIEKDTIELMIGAQMAHPEFDIISPVHLNGTGTALDYNFSVYMSPRSCPGFLSDAYLNKIKDTIYEVKFANAAAWLISRKCISIVGGFNPLFFIYGEDDNYIHRLSYHGLRIGVLPSARIYHDREGRKENYEKDESEKKYRLMQYANPNLDSNIAIDIRRYQRSYLKNLLLCRFSEIKKAKKMIAELNRYSNEISKSLQISKIPGLSFLDEDNE